MAHVTVKETKTRNFVVEMSEDQVEILLVVLGHVGGPTFGRRSLIEDLFDSLQKAGAKWDYNSDEVSGSITFRDPDR